MTSTEPEAPGPEPGGVGRRIGWWLAALLAVVALAGGGLFFGQGSNEPAPSGQARRQAPAIELPALSGDGRVSLADLRGRPAVVNLFASWCVPCRKELPAVAAVAEQLQGRVGFLGVNHQDNRKAGQDMAAEFRLPYPTAYDPDGRVAADYALIGMPTTLFIAADGTLLETHTGELSRQQLERSIARLFGVS